MAEQWPTQEQFDAASAQGSDRAREQSNVGRVRPEETPLSGEYTDSPSPRSVARDVGFILSGDQDADALEALAEAWEQGYYDVWEYLGQ